MHPAAGQGRCRAAGETDPRFADHCARVRMLLQCMIERFRTAVFGGTTLPDSDMPPGPATPRPRDVGRVVSAVVCRAVLWLVAIFAVGEIQFGKSGPSGASTAHVVSAGTPTCAAEGPGRSWHMSAPDSQVGPDRSDVADSCDEPGLASLLAPPRRSHLTIVAAGFADVPADRTPTGIASARAPPASRQS